MLRSSSSGSCSPLLSTQLAKPLFISTANEEGGGGRETYRMGKGRLLSKSFAMPLLPSKTGLGRRPTDGRHFPYQGLLLLLPSLYTMCENPPPPRAEKRKVRS